MDSRCFGTGPDVVILSDDFAGLEGKSCFRMTRSQPSDEDLRGTHPVGRGTPGSRQQAEFFAALHGLGAAGGSELVEGAGTVSLDGVLGNE